MSTTERPLLVIPGDDPVQIAGSPGWRPLENISKSVSSTIVRPMMLRNWSEPPVPPP
ncbi:MAG: hypothetical protein Ct9H300mP1_12230 [Planctomycetaceae bacterium]|nr:MAG: hypothetical protein Ct9H300mP1_12230 [Planctomycetaceae bacterium]